MNKFGSEIDAALKISLYTQVWEHHSPLKTSKTNTLLGEYTHLCPSCILATKCATSLLNNIRREKKTTLRFNIFFLLLRALHHFVAKQRRLG